MKQLLFIALLTFTTTLQTPQVNNGTIEGRVTRVGSSEGISDVQVTLVGPSPITSAAALGGLYTPSSSLTPSMREQIDQLINSAPPGITLEVVANAAIRMEAQLLGLPAPNIAPVAAGAASQPPPQTVVVTNSEGLFSFKNLAAGRYQIRAQRDGYFGTPPPGAAGIGAPTIVNSTVTVTAGQNATLAMSMLRGAIVSGRVRDPNGQPLQTSQVSAFQINYQQGRKVLQQVNSKQTDDRGEYRLYWLPPGDYLLGAIPRRAGPVNAAPTAQDNYARTFFPNMVDARSATVVHAGEGAEISGIDVLVRPDATGRILGRVIHSYVNPNGQPAIAGTFYLFPVDPVGMLDTGITTFQNVAANRTAGEFELRGLLPGPYELMSNVPDGNGRQVWGRTRVNVTPGEVRDVILSITPGVELKAQLSVDGAAPPFTMQAPPIVGRGSISVINGVVTQAPPPAPAAPVPTPTYRIQLRSAENFAVSLPFEGNTNQDTVFDPSGITTFRSVVPGKYYVTAAPLPPNAYVADVKAGGSSVYDSGVDINSQTGEIQVVVNTNGGKVQGHVIDAAQKQVAQARVVLVPAERRRQNAQLYKVGTTDTSGNFTMNGIAPGDYKLFAWEAVPNTAWLNPEFLAPYEGRGLAVTITSAGSTPASIELKLIAKEPERP